MVMNVYYENILNFMGLVFLNIIQHVSVYKYTENVIRGIGNT